jgi:hypothetical protein
MVSRRSEDGRVWGRPEAVDSLGRVPGRHRRTLGTLVGLASVVGGIYLGFGQGMAGTAASTASAAPTAAAPPAEQAKATCASIGINLAAGRFPAEGVPESSVVRLFRADRDGQARLLVPQAHVLTSVPGPDGAVTLSVLVRSGPGEGDRIVNEINGANADGTLTSAVLYDVDPLEVLDECRRQQ